MEGINIYSGSKGLGAALTNPTELGFRKGNLSKRYPVTLNGKEYPDSETAYQVLKQGLGSAAEADDLMKHLIAIKFEAYPELAAEVAKRGGVEFLKACTHFTNAKSAGAQSWEGAGLDSRFIKILVSGYEAFLNKENDFNKQRSLF